MNQMMVDIESLDVRPTTVILSIGAVVFDDEKVLKHITLHERCLWQDQIDAGRSIREGTLRWWFQQSQEARDALFSGQIPLRFCLGRLSALYVDEGCERVWANGSTFDISALEHAFHWAGFDAPWEYNAMRDMRGLRDLVPADIMADTPNLAAHDALADAVWQAEFVVRALRFLKK